MCIRSLGWEDPWRRALQYSYQENSHEQKTLVGYSPHGCKELDMTEVT